MFSDTTKARAKHWAKRLECPVDDNSNYENTYWCNRDLIPIPYDRRTWTWQGYSGYWVINGINTTAWTAGSSLLGFGLTVGQTMGIIVGAALISSIIAVITGWMGSHHYLGFTVLARGSWGMRGGFWPVLNRLMTACIWMGIQTYWGGQSIKIILGAIIGPKFAYMENTLPASANVDTSSLISFFIFLLIFLPFLLIRPEKLQLPFRIAFVMITCTMFGMLIWALCAAHGAGALVNSGLLVDSGATASGGALSWSAVYGLQSIVGGYASGCLGQSDWTRYAKTPNAALFGQAVTAPLTICITALCGVLITSATATIYGEYLWNPFQLLFAIQANSMSAGARAGTFFAGFGFLVSQLGLCLVINCVSTGMDMAALCPKYINIRRGSFILTIIAVATCPWNFVTNSSVFITVLSGWSVFLSPMTGILISDYFLVRKQELHVGDLYLGVNKAGAYWYTAGFNWRAITAWVIGLGPLLPGFIRNVQRMSDGSGWDHLYQISYFYGFFAALFTHWALHSAFPTVRQRGSSPFVMELHTQPRLTADSSSTDSQYEAKLDAKQSV